MGWPARRRHSAAIASASALLAEQPRSAEQPEAGAPAVLERPVRGITTAMPSIRYLDDAGQSRTLTIDSQPVVIGRVATCQIAIADDLISREHARIDREPDGRYRIRDLGSRNKTFVNGQTITETLLAPGDIVRIGDRILEFVDDGTVEKIDLEFLTPDRTDPTGSEWVKFKQPVTLTATQLESLSRLSANLGATARPEDIAGSALSQLVVDLQAERGFVAVKGEGKRDLRAIAQRGLSRTPGASLTPVSQTFVYAAILQSVAGRYPEHPDDLQTKAGYASTGIVAPISYRGEIVGLIYLDRTKARQPFAAATVQHLLAAGTQLGAMMADASRRLVEGAAREGAAWLATARRLQASLTSMPARGEVFDVATRLIAGRTRCGDFVDIIHLGPDRCVVALFDASGQGLAGLVQAVGLRSAMRASLRSAGDEPNLAGVFATLNDVACNHATRKLVTVNAVSIDLASARVSYISAAGPPPILLAGAGRLVTLEHPSLMLGVDSAYTYEATTVDLPSPFLLVCHSDGWTESTNAAGEVYGDKRLHELLLDRATFGPPAVVVEKAAAAFNAHVAGHPHDDDALVVAVGT